MKIAFRLMDYKNRDEFLLLEKWHNGKFFRDIYAWNPSKEDYFTHFTPEMILRTYRESKETTQRYFILGDETPIGEISYSLNPKFLFRKDGPTFFIQIQIPEDMGNERPKIQKKSLEFLEGLAKEDEIPFLEISVFEQDYQGMKFFKDAGFREVGRVPQWTYKAGRMWGDVRMQKTLSTKAKS